MKVLFASDGSACSERAARYIGKTLKAHVNDLQVTLLFVDEPMMPQVKRALGKDEVARIQRENAEFHLRAVRRRLLRAGVEFVEAIDDGDPATCIAERTAGGHFELVLMGSHGRGALGNLLLGSVTAKVLARSKVPVLAVP
ncbi:MAG: universal stress protein [Proteobacteria bacterium]|nr:universal stress protein [Pseudomonadota bacterium]